MHSPTEDPTFTHNTPRSRPGRQFVRALRRSAERDATTLVRDERGTVWTREAHEAHRAAVARYATAQQVARNKTQQARAAAVDRLKAAQAAYGEAEQAGGRCSPTVVGELRHAEREVARLEALPLPVVPRVPSAGQQVETPYVGGDRLIVNRYAHLPAGTRAPRRRIYPEGMSPEIEAEVHRRAYRAGWREAAQTARRQPRTRRERKSARRGRRTVPAHAAEVLAFVAEHLAA